MATALGAEARESLRRDHPGWDIDGEIASRTFVFADFAEAMGFVSRIGLASEAVDHHPDIDIRWNKVTLALTTHSESALTDKDRDLIATIDSWSD